jgi:hypothetical protein
MLLAMNGGGVDWGVRREKPGADTLRMEAGGYLRDYRF